jgi:putative ATP-dependent endonuclease of OLD family
MLGLAIELHGRSLIDDHIKSVAKNAKNLDAVQGELLVDCLATETRAFLGKASRTKKAGWFKSVSWMEEVGREIVGPDLATADAGFQAIIKSLFIWTNSG